jgi:hypothetical protein
MCAVRETAASHTDLNNYTKERDFNQALEVSKETKRRILMKKLEQKSRAAASLIKLLFLGADYSAGGSEEAGKPVFWNEPTFSGIFTPNRIEA